MELCITRPQSTDLVKLHQLFEAAIEDAFAQDGINDPAGVDEEVARQMALVQQDLASNGADAFCLIARTEAVILGTIAYSKPNDLIRTHVQIDLQQIPEITSVYVRPEYQGKGVGSLLFNAILLTLLSQAVERFCLDGGYKKSQQFWLKKLGTPTQILANYWGDGLDHMIWLCNLSDLQIRYLLADN